MNLFAYLRVSGLSQKDGDGFPRQLEACRKFCTANHINLVQHFEEAFTGTEDGMNRPALVELLTQIDVRNRNLDKCATDLQRNAMKVHGIVVEKMDRLARDLIVSEMLIRECTKRGVSVYCADQGLTDLSTADIEPTRKLIRQVMGAFAEFEKSALVAKLKAARDRIIAKEGRCGGRRPLEETPEGMAAIRFARTLRFHTGLTMEEIAERLNAKGYLTSHKKPYNRATVWKLLKNEKLINGRIPGKLAWQLRREQERAAKLNRCPGAPVNPPPEESPSTESRTDAV